MVARPQLVVALPTLTTRVFLISDTVAGLAPPNAVLTVSLTSNAVTPSAQLSALSSASALATRIVTATADGTYVANFTSLIDLDPRALGLVQLVTLEGNSISRGFVASTAQNCIPQLVRANVGGDELTITLDSDCKPGAMRLRSTNSTLKFEKIYAVGYIATIFYVDGMPDPVRIEPGDVIELNSTDGRTVITVPALSVNFDPDTNTVTGTALPNTLVRVKLRDINDSASFDSVVPAPFITTVADANGSYRITLGSMKLPRVDIANAKPNVRFDN